MPSNTGGLQPEQRDAFARHELGTVDQDLHRRRRDMHFDAALVAEIDELHGFRLGEGGVGENDLLDPVLREDLREVFERAERPQAVLRARCQRDVADDVDAGA